MLSITFIKKNFHFIEIISVLTLIHIFGNNRPEQVQELISYIQAFFTSLFPNHHGTFGNKIISIVVGMIVLFTFQKKFIFKIFFPHHFLKEISLALCTGIIMLIPVFLGLITSILKVTNISFNIMAAVLTFSVINSFAEEIINRAYPLVRSSLNKPTFTFNQIITNKYLWVSSLFFGLGHFTNYGMWGLTAILSGFAFGLLYLWRGNIWPSFFAHTGMQLSMQFVKDMSFSLHFLIMSIAFLCSCFFTWWVTVGYSNNGSTIRYKTKGTMNLVAKDKLPDI